MISKNNSNSNSSMSVMIGTRRSIVGLLFVVAAYESRGHYFRRRWVVPRVLRSYPEISGGICWLPNISRRTHLSSIDPSSIGFY